MTARTLKLACAALALAVAAPAAAQTPPAELGARYVPAPWWMREPVIASIGRVRTQVPANRGTFTAQFQSVERTAAEATASAAAKVRALDAQLRAFGADKVRVETTFQTRPLYEQYRDREGNIQTNERSDKIERYEVTANLSIEVRDMAVVERAYATVLAAQPTSVGRVYFRLEPDNATKTWLASEAVKDARRRAANAAEAAGGRLGGIKVIDPTGRACQTDVLAGWPAYAGGGQATDVQYAGAPAVALAPPPPPPPPVSPRAAARDQVTVENMQLSLQPPSQTLDDEACVVYGIQ